jgi:hypothetical protein
MSLWLEPIQRCWTWLSYTLFTDLAKTHVVECRASVMDTTQVVACAPTVRVRAVSRVDLAKRHQEKRVAMRYPCDREVQFFTERHSEPLTGRLRNLSACGLGLVVAKPIEAGTALVIELDDPLEVDARVLAVTVVHSRPMPIRGWFLGCALAQELSDEELRDIV